MNCIEYRHALLVNPRSQNRNMQEHLHSCETCAQFTHEQMVLEARMQNVMQLDVPEGLASRILLRQSVEQKRTGRMKWSYFAMAASIVFAGVLAVLLQATPIFEQPIEQLALQHVYAEEKHLADRHNIPLAELNSILQVANVQLREHETTIHYAGKCDIRDDAGAHVVMAGEQGPVTLLFIPGEHVSSRQRLDDARFKVIVTPIEGGSLAIIGDKTEPLQRLEQQLRRNMVFI